MQSKYLDYWQLKKIHLVTKVIFFVYISNKCLLSQAFCWPLEIGKKQNNYTHGCLHTHKKNSEKIKIRKLSPCCLQTSEGDI